MKPEKFLSSYKCDCFQPNNSCNCPKKIVSSDVFMENVIDIADSLVTVLNLCGLINEHTNSIRDVIINHFLNFEETLHRIDSVPRKRLRKEDLIHDLGRKCFMNRMESQMAYSIIKRAFKAFYYGTVMGGVPNSRLKNKLTHTSECLWIHAVQRTAQICASYGGMFHAFQKDLECKIKLVYKQLYDRISNRKLPTDEHDQECNCPNCIKRIANETLKEVKVTTGMHIVDDPYEAAYLREQDIELEKQTPANLESIGGIENGVQTHCTCSSLKMTEKDYVYRKNAESTQTGSSQGPFECQWIPISKEEFEADEANLLVGIKLPDDILHSRCQSNAIHRDREEECSCDDSACESFIEMECEEEVKTEIEEFVTEKISSPSMASIPY